MGTRPLTLKATEQDRARLEDEIGRLVEQLKAMGAAKVMLFGSLARGKISLFSDIDLLVLFDDGRSGHELTQWVYQQIHAREAVDIIARSVADFERQRHRPFFRHILSEAKVLYERPTERS